MTSVHSIADAIALSLLHSLWQDSLLALIAACALALQSRGSAASRHATALAFLLAMAAAPLLTFARLVADPDLAAGGVATLLSVTDAPAMLSFLPGPPTLVVAPWLPWCWAAGVALMLARLAGGWWLVNTLDRARFQVLPSHWVVRCNALRHSMGIHRQVAFRLLEDVALPFSARLWRPVVWLPVAMLTRLPPSHVEALIAHELAHVQRLDWVWNGLQRIVEALLFFHPGMWWLSRRIRQERENACDDLAVAACGDAIVLVEALGALEGLRAPAHILCLSANGGSLMQRVTRLLSSDAPSRAPWGVPLGLIAVLCSGSLLAANLVPSAGAVKPATFEPASGPFGTGNSRTYREHSSAGLKEYQRRVDRLGRVTETVTLNGQPLDIDAGVRAWIDAKDADASIAAALPALPSKSPEPPKAFDSLMSESTAFKAAVASVQQSPRLVAALGTPIVATGAVRGKLSDASLFGSASAALQIGLSGPKGTAVLEAQGKLDGSTWQFSALNVTPDHGANLDLAVRQ